MSGRKKGTFRIPNKKDLKDISSENIDSAKCKRKFKGCTSETTDKNKTSVTKRQKRENENNNKLKKSASKNGENDADDIARSESNLNNKTANSGAFILTKYAENKCEKNESPLKKCKYDFLNEDNTMSESKKLNEKENEAILKTYKTEDKIKNEIELLFNDMLNEICNTLKCREETRKGDISNKINVEGAENTSTIPFIFPEQKSKMSKNYPQHKFHDKNFKSEFDLKDPVDKMINMTENNISFDREYKDNGKSEEQIETLMINEITPEYSGNVYGDQKLSTEYALNGVELDEEMFFEETKHPETIRNSFEKETTDFSGKKNASDAKENEIMTKDENADVISGVKIHSDIKALPENEDNCMPKVSPEKVPEDVFTDIKCKNDVNFGNGSGNRVSDVNTGTFHIKDFQMKTQIEKDKEFDISETEIKEIRKKKFRFSSFQKIEPTIDNIITSNKILKIPCMSALDYEKEMKMTGVNYPEISNLVPENGKSSSPGNIEDLNSDHNQYFKIPNSQHKLEDNLPKIDHLEDWNIIQNPVPHFKGSIANPEIEIPDNPSEQSSAKIKEPTAANSIIEKENNKINQNLNNPDAMKKIDDEIACKSVNTTSDIDISESRVKSGISADEHVCIESIVFREKDEAEESDAIPTGVFKPMNEIFEYNKETTTIDVKELDMCNSTSGSTLNKTDNLDINKDAAESSKREMNIETLKVGCATFLVTASDCIKTADKSRPQANHEELYSEKLYTLYDVKIAGKEIQDENKEIAKFPNFLLKSKGRDSSTKDNESASIENNKIKDKAETEMDNSLDTIYGSQKSVNEEKSNSDIENCMDMDDDFALTASQLSMLDANEKMQVETITKSNSSQQTDIIGYTYFGNDAVTFEIINQLHYIRNSIEEIKERLDRL